MIKTKVIEKRKVGLDVYIITTLVSTLLFITGLSLGMALSTQQMNVLDYEITNMRNSIENIELEFFFLDMMSGNISCSYLIGEANRLAVESSDLGARVDQYEQTQRFEDPNYISLKSRYMLVTVRDWLTIERIKRTCYSDYRTVLYLYGDNCADCATQGFILTYLKEKYPQKLMIFSLDTSLDVPIVNALRTSYNVTQYPSLVIEGRTYSGLIDAATLESILNITVI